MTTNTAKTAHASALRPWTLVSVLLSLGLGQALAQTWSMGEGRSPDPAPQPALELVAFHSPSRAGAVPTMTLGVRYHLSEQHVLFANTSGVRGALGSRGLGADLAAADVTTKLGLEWKPARSALGLERGAIGVQLDSGYRLSLRTRRGGAGLYLRGNF